MARENSNLDQFFKEKLSQDSIKPSKLAWERLESQLPKQEKKRTPFILWAAAASVAVLLVAGYFNMDFSTNPEDQNLLAEVGEEITENVTQAESEATLEIEQPKELATAAIEPTKIENKTKPTTTTNSTTQNKVKSSTTNLIAVAEKSEEKEKPTTQAETTPIVEELDLPPLTLPDLQVNKTLATVETASVEEPAYRVKIYSSGLEEDKNLITGINKKVEKVEGFLGKVDQGFADLQDAKSNLFTTLLSKKEKVAEKP